MIRSTGIYIFIYHRHRSSSSFKSSKRVQM